MRTRGARQHRSAQALAFGLCLLVLGLAACGRPGAAPSSRPVSSSGSATTKPSATTSTAPTTTEPPVTSVDGKVTVLEVGDSLGIDLGWGMQWALGSDSSVDLVQDAYGDSGLSNEAFYDWPSVLETELQATHPQIVVVFLGANDHQGFPCGTGDCEPGTAAWDTAYAARVATMMSEATAAGARVLWVGMPVMESPSFSAEMVHINSIFRAEAALHPGVTYFSSWSVFSTPSGAYNGGDTDVTGEEEPLRDPDGIHLDVGGEDLLGSVVVQELKSLYKLP